MQLSDIVSSVRRHWRVSIAILLLAGVGLGLFLFNRKVVRGSDRYEAVVKVLVPVRGKDNQIPPGVPPALLFGQSAIALSPETTGNALKAAGLNESNRGDVEFGFVTPIPSKANNAPPPDILTLSATAGDPKTATRLASSFADAYIAQRRNTVAGGDTHSKDGARNSLVRLGTKLSQVNEQLGLIDPVLLAQLAATDSQATTGSGQNLPPIALPANTPLDTVLLAYERRTLIDRIAATRQAYADSSTQSIVPQDFASIVERDAPLQIIPALPSPLIPIVVAAALGILLAIGIPVLMDFLDHSIRDPRTAGNALSARVLSTIPPTSPSTLAALARPGSARDAAYRALAATSVSTDELPRAIVVTSPVGDMQDSVAANFAAALAGLGLRVALIATEARQAWFLGADRAPNAATLPDLLALARSGSLNGQISDALVPTQLANLAVLAPGATEADDLLDGLPALLEALARSGIDVTVIAAPALLEDPAATILAWSTRSVLWVIEAGEVTEPEAREAASRLALAGATPFGVAMVDAKG